VNVGEPGSLEHQSRVGFPHPGDVVSDRPVKEGYILW